MKKNYLFNIILTISAVFHIVLIYYIVLPEHFLFDKNKISINYQITEPPPPQKPKVLPKPKPKPKPKSKPKPKPKTPIQKPPPPPPPEPVPENAIVIPEKLIETASVWESSPRDLEEYDTETVQPEPVPETAPIPPPPEPEPEPKPKIDIDAIVKEYGRSIHIMIEQHKIYPQKAKRFGKQGIVEIDFIISRNGQLGETKISESSGTKILDEAALKAVNKAAPFPPLPEILDMDNLNLKIKLLYKIR